MNITGEVRRFLNAYFTLDDALPASMPVYVNSVAYLFGVSAISMLGMLVISGIVMCAFGPAWYHHSSIGHYVNSLHFWSVQLFFGAVILHATSKFSMAAWRDGRWTTWMAGALIFATAVFTGLTGFIIQTNWDSQWIAVQAKDAMNAAGIGAFFNTLNTLQVLTIHVLVLPVLIGILLSLHLFFIRSEGPVKPIPAKGRTR